MRVCVCGERDKDKKKKKIAYPILSVFNNCVFESVGFGLASLIYYYWALLFIVIGRSLVGWF